MHDECYKLSLFMYMADLNVPSRHSLTVTQTAWQRLMLNSTYLQMIKMENTMFNLFNPSFRGNINNFTNKFEKIIISKPRLFQFPYYTVRCPRCILCMMGPVCILYVMLY